MNRIAAFFTLALLSPILLFLFLLHWIDENVHALANIALNTIQGELNNTGEQK